MGTSPSDAAHKSCPHFCAYLSVMHAQVVGFPLCYKVGRTDGSQVFRPLENYKIQVNAVVGGGLHFLLSRVTI